MGDVQAQLAKQPVFASDPHIMTHVSDLPPSAARRPISPRDRTVSRLSASFFGALFFISISSLRPQSTANAGARGVAQILRRHNLKSGS